MKVPTKNLKIQFLSQLRKHLRSPRLNKILHKKKRKTKKTTNCKPVTDGKSSINSVNATGIARNNFRINVIKKAGEKLKEGFKRNWTSDPIAKKRQELIEYALQKNKIVTASSLVKAEDSEKSSRFNKSSNVSSSSSEEMHNKFLENPFSSKEYYLHCSSTESSPCSSKAIFSEKDENSDHHTEILSKRNVNANDDQHTFEYNSDNPSIQLYNPGPLKTCQVDVGVQCSQEDLSLHSIVTKHSSELRSDLTKGSILAKNERSEADDLSCYNGPSSNSNLPDIAGSSATENANIMLKKMAEFLERESCYSTSFQTSAFLGPSQSPVCSAMSKPASPAPSTSHCSCRQSYSVNWMLPRQEFNTESVSYRKFSSEKIPAIRSNLFNQPSIKRRRKTLDCQEYTQNFVYDLTSSSDSDDDEILKRIKKKLKEDDDLDQKICSFRHRPSYSSWTSYTKYLSSDTDSSPGYLHKSSFLTH